MEQFLNLLGLGVNNPVAGGTGLTTAQFIIGIIRNAIVLVFALLVIFAIVYSLISGYKFITSQGASEKVEEARESIKYVLIGFAAAFIGIIGIFIISGIFSPNTDAENSLRCFFGDFYACSGGSTKVAYVDKNMTDRDKTCSITCQGGSANSIVNGGFACLTAAAPTSTCSVCINAVAAAVPLAAAGTSNEQAILAGQILPDHCK